MSIKNEIHKLNKNNWYECIEEPIRDLVFRLRNNGFNTECSCGHEKYIQCQYILNAEILRLNRTVACFLSEYKKPLNYEINITIKVIDGHQYSSLIIYLK